jgi:hypothetical protein
LSSYSHLSSEFNRLYFRRASKLTIDFLEKLLRDCVVDLFLGRVELNLDLLQIESFELDEGPSHMTAVVCLAMDDGAKRIDQPIFSMVRPLDWQNIVKYEILRTEAKPTLQKLCVNTS